MQDKTKRIFLWLGFISIFSTMAGCAAMNKSECLNANWHEIGKSDGLKGRNIFSTRAKACSEHGVGADGSAYAQGVQASLPAFCTAASGREYGTNGNIYKRGFCPASTESEFLSGYTPAYEKFEFRKKMKDLQEKIEIKNKMLSYELDQLPARRNNIESLRNDIKSLNRELQTEMLLRVLD